MSPDMHHNLADWVKKGGVLIYCGRDDDPYQSVMEWWNTNGNTFKAPSEHLFKLLHIKKESNASHFSYGKGSISIVRQHPKEFVMEPNAAGEFLDIVRNCYEKDAKEFFFSFQECIEYIECHANSFTVITQKFIA